MLVHSAYMESCGDEIVMTADHTSAHDNALDITG